MAPQQQVVYRMTHPSIIGQKVQLTYKLFLLENARNTLEKQLLDFTNKAYEEVQGFLKSSSHSSVFRDLAKALDTKCEVVDKLSAVLKELTVEPHVCVKNGVGTNQLQPLGGKGTPMTDVLKFGHMLQNSLMAVSIAKAVQVLGSTLSLQPLKHFLNSQSAAVQQDDMMWSISSGYDNAVATTSPSSHLTAEEEHAVIPEEKQPPDAVIPPPVIIQSPKVDTERPPLLLPPIQAIFPEISNPKPMKITPLISWGWEEDVQVQHQKQTSSQLLHFLRTKAKNMGALEVSVMEWKRSKYSSSLPQSTLPSIKTQSYQFRHVVTDDLINAPAPKTLSANMENQAPVFRVKRAESSGFLTYTCVIATKTELWDFGDIFTKVRQGNSDANPLENNSRNITAQVENYCVNVQRATQTLQCTEPVHKSSSAGAETPAINGITIPEFQVPRFEETEVVVSHIVSPGNFYIQHADSIVKLQALVTDSWKASSSYAEQNCIPDIGTQVMGWFPKQEQWCRARVTKICGVSEANNATDGAGSETSIQVEVQRLDHGDTARLSLWNVKELTPEMAVPPLQALRVSLANVTPVNGSDWTEEAVGWFQTMVHNRTLYARLYPRGPKVELFLEKGKLGAMRRGASLSLRLAQNGHAKHNNVSHMKRGTIQLKMRKRDSEWEKYLISCYTRSKK